MDTVHIIAVAYKKYGELRVFVQSWLNQSDRNWILTVIHDGYDDEFVQIMKYFAAIEPDKIDYQCTDIRFNDYGHSLREIGQHSARGDYVLLTNADNYYIPKALEFINAALLERLSTKGTADKIIKEQPTLLRIFIYTFKLLVSFNFFIFLGFFLFFSRIFSLSHNFS